MFYDSESAFHGCSCGLMHGDLDTIVPGWSDEPEKMAHLREGQKLRAL